MIGRADSPLDPRPDRPPATRPETPLDPAALHPAPGGQTPEGERRVPRWVWPGLALAIWLGVIAFNSTDLASGAHTDELLLRFVRLFTSAETGTGSAGFGALSWAVRKLGHVIEYGVLGGLLTVVLSSFFPRHVRGSGWELLGRAALLTLPCGLVVALADELHQTFVVSRTGKPTDVLVDLLGLAVGLLVVWLAWRRGGKAPS